MGKAKNKTEKARLTAKAVDLYLANKTQTEIAKEIGRSQQWVSLALREQRKKWISEAHELYDAWINRELEIIDEVHWNAWKMFCKSCENYTETSREVGETPKGPVDKTIEKDMVLTGNPKYLDIILNCSDRRIKLLGSDTYLRYKDKNEAIKQIESDGMVAIPRSKYEALTNSNQS